MCIRDSHRGDERYPKTVEELANPPQTLYVRGDPSILDAPSLSIIGARKSTPYGRAIAEMAGRIAAESGIVVVSGGARGCDQAGGMGALNAGGRHVVVLGTGADVVYPSSAGRLIDRSLLQGGCVPVSYTHLKTSSPEMKDPVHRPRAIRTNRRTLPNAGRRP